MARHRKRNNSPITFTTGITVYSGYRACLLSVRDSKSYQICDYKPK